MKSAIDKISKILLTALRIETCEDAYSEKLCANEEDLPLLYNFSKEYDLAHIVANALEKAELLEENSEIKKLFFKERDIAIMRYEQRRYEIEAICKAFNDAKIPFILLKGAYLQKFYKSEWMRTSCDIDVLVEESNLNFAIQTLKDKLNYSCESVSKHDAQMFAPSGVHLELHFSLVGDVNYYEYKTLFEKVWENENDGDSFNRIMKGEFFYTYFILHMAKHVKEGGCGIRPFLDLYLIRKNMGLDSETCKNLLKEIKLYTFAKGAESLSEVWFSLKKPTAQDKDLEDYIFTGGLYGTVQNRVSIQTGRKNGKLNFIISRIFLPYEKLKSYYPILEKRKILTPFYQIKRWFSLLSKEKRQSAKIELKTALNQKETHSQKIEKLFKNLEL